MWALCSVYARPMRSFAAIVAENAVNGMQTVHCSADSLDKFQNNNFFNKSNSFVQSVTPDGPTAMLLRKSPAIMSLIVNYYRRREWNYSTIICQKQTKQFFFPPNGWDDAEPECRCVYALNIARMCCSSDCKCCAGCTTTTRISPYAYMAIRHVYINIDTRWIHATKISMWMRRIFDILITMATERVSTIK